MEVCQKFPASQGPVSAALRLSVQLDMPNDMVSLEEQFTNEQNDSRSLEHFGTEGSAIDEASMLLEVLFPVHSDNDENMLPDSDPDGIQAFLESEPELGEDLLDKTIPNDLEFYDNNADTMLDSYKTVEFEDGVPVLEEFAYVNEVACIGCTYCATIARNTFYMEEDLGRARVFRQGADDKDVIDEAIDSCPVDCIYYLSFDELVANEIERKDIKINFVGQLVSRAEGGGMLSAKAYHQDKIVRTVEYERERAAKIANETMEAPKMQQQSATMVLNDMQLDNRRIRAQAVKQEDLDLTPALTGLFRDSEFSGSNDSDHLGPTSRPYDSVDEDTEITNVMDTIFSDQYSENF